MDWENGTLRIYVDDEAVASITVTLSELASMGKFPLMGKPWATHLMGQTAASGGVSTTIRIPFGRAIRTTIQAPTSYRSASTFWFMIRGMECMQVQWGDFILPSQARLKLHRQDNVELAPLQFITVAKVPEGVSGALVLMKLDAKVSLPCPLTTPSIPWGCAPTAFVPPPQIQIVLPPP